MADKQSPRVLQPTDRAFDDPAMPIPPETAAVLSRRLLAVLPVRADQSHAATFQRITQPIRVGGLVVQQTLRPLSGDLNLHQCFNATDLGMTGGGGQAGDRRSPSIDQEHDLGALAAFGIADVGTPFFAGENVPSPMTWDQCSSFRRSIRTSKSFQASSSTPVSVHSLSRRQQVVEDGYRSGKNFQCAPVVRIHSTPSRQARGSTRGRPPRGEGSGFSNRCRMRFHWESVTKGFGAVLDPVVFGRRRFGHKDREMSM